MTAMIDEIKRKREKGMLAEKRGKVKSQEKKDEKRQKVNDTETLCTLQNVLQQNDKHGEMS